MARTPEGQPQDRLGDLIDALLEDGVYGAAHPPIPWELADALWLAARRRLAAGVEAAAAKPHAPEGSSTQTDPEPRPKPSAASTMPPGGRARADQGPPAGIHRPPDSESGAPGPTARETPLHILEPDGAAGLAGPAQGAATARIGRPRVLSRPLDLARALRPLQQRVPSRQRLVLDEQATVHRMAELRLPVPVLRGLPERRLELALVVDDHPGFILWEPLVQELSTLLAGQGAFRDLRVWRIGALDQAPDAPTCLRPGLHGGSPRPPGVLCDHRGRRAVLVLSDFSAPRWRAGFSPEPNERPQHLDALRLWQRQQPVVLVHLLPQAHWRRTGLGGARLGRLDARPGLPPRLLGADGADARAPDWPLALPVLQLDPVGLADWARLLGGHTALRIAVARFPRSLQPQRAATPADQDPDPRRRLSAFKLGASAGARNLARACAGMPLTLPVVRLAQQACTDTGAGSNPGTGGAAELAELFLGGLLQPAEVQLSDHPQPLEMVYDFPPGVRQLLIDEQHPDQLADNLHRVSEAVRSRLGAAQDFLVRFLDPDLPLRPGDHFNPRYKPFARIQLQVMRRLGRRFGPEEQPWLDWVEDRPKPAAIAADVLLITRDRPTSEALRRAFAARYRVQPQVVAGWDGRIEDLGTLNDARLLHLRLAGLGGWDGQAQARVGQALDACRPRAVLELGVAERELRSSQGVGDLFLVEDIDDGTRMGDPALSATPWLAEAMALASTFAVETGIYSGMLVCNEYGQEEWTDEPREETYAIEQRPTIGFECERRGVAWMALRGLAGVRARSDRADYLDAEDEDLAVAASRLAAHMLVALERTRFVPTGFRDIVPGGGPEMVWLPGGRFTMGSPEDVGEQREHPAHEVTLSHYAVGRYPVTVGEFRRFVEATKYVTDAEKGSGAYVWNRGDPGTKEDANWRNPYMEQDDSHPVICISWNDAKAYCDWLGEETGQHYGLLTEAQWEHACRAGGAGRWCFGDDERRLEDYAWYGRKAGDGTQPVGGKLPNAWQLHDMHGNVWEWCADWYADDTYKHRMASTEISAASSRGDSRGDTAAAVGASDPSGPSEGSVRVVRGGAWGGGADDCRSACRDGGDPSGRGDGLGFRLSRTGPLRSFPFTLGGNEVEPELVPAYLAGLHDTLADGSQAPAMVWLRGGRFTMGQDDSPYGDEKPAHPVAVSAFSIGQYPLTFDEYDRFCEITGRDKPDDQGWGRGRRPVINISWDDARAYCDWLNGQQQDGTYRLLTEAEWEFACRAGSETRWSFGDDERQLVEHAWYGENADGKTHPVGGKQPNAWQLHDMHGNVWEWCADWFAEDTYKHRAASTAGAEATTASIRGDSSGNAAAVVGASDPSGPTEGSIRVIRGGAWSDDADICRSACRGWDDPSNRDDSLGFRLSRTGPWPSYPFTLVRGEEKPATQAIGGEGVDSLETGERTVTEALTPYQGFRDRFVIVRKDGRTEPAAAPRQGPEMVYLPSGIFRMGDEHGDDDEKPVHRVALDAFAISRTPVTWGEYRRFCEDTDKRWPEWLDLGSQYHLEKGSDDYYSKCGVARDAEDLPVVGVSWHDAVAYCAWLAERTDRPYRLPTEAEWEYACRAGTETRWSFGDDEEALGDHGWYGNNADGKLHPVGEKRPNPWGLLDMHGNVWEWCADWFAADNYEQRVQAARRDASGNAGSRGASRGDTGPLDAVVVAPTGASEGSYRVIRGGAWSDDADNCRSACRYGLDPSYRFNYLGFRLSRTV